MEVPKTADGKPLPEYIKIIVIEHNCINKTFGVSGHIVDKRLAFKMIWEAVKLIIKFKIKK